MKPQQSLVATKKKIKPQTPNKKVKVQETKQPSLKSNGTIKKKAMKVKSPVLKVNSEKQKKKIALGLTTGAAVTPVKKVPISPKPEKEKKQPAIKTPSKAAAEEKPQRNKMNKTVGFTSEHLLTLLDQIEKLIPVNDAHRPQKTIETLPWSKVHIRGFTWMQCKEQFMRIRSMERVYRTLEEIVVDVKELLKEGAQNGWTESAKPAQKEKESNVLQEEQEDEGEDEEEEMEDDDDSNAEEAEESDEGEEEEEDEDNDDDDDDDGDSDDDE